MAGATASAARASQLVLTRFPPPASKSANEAAITAAVDAAVAAAAAAAPDVAALAASEESAGSAEDVGAAASTASSGSFGSGAAPGEAECAAPSGYGLTTSVAAAAATNTVTAASALLGERACGEALGVENANALHSRTIGTTPALRVVAARDMQLLALARRGLDGLAADEQQGVREVGSDAQGTSRVSRESAALGPAAKKRRGSLDWDSEASEQRVAALGEAYGPGRNPEIPWSICPDSALGAEPCHGEFEQAGSIGLPGNAAQPMAEQQRQEPYPDPYPGQGQPVAATSHTRQRKLHGSHRGAQDMKVESGTSNIGSSELDDGDRGSNRRGERGVHRREVAALSKEDEESFWNGNWGEPESGEIASILPSQEELAGTAGAGEAV